MNEERDESFIQKLLEEVRVDSNDRPTVTENSITNVLLIAGPVTDYADISVPFQLVPNPVGLSNTSSTSLGLLVPSVPALVTAEPVPSSKCSFGRPKSDKIKKTYCNKAKPTDKPMPELFKISSDSSNLLLKRALFPYKLHNTLYIISSFFAV